MTTSGGSKNFDTCSCLNGDDYFANFIERYIGMDDSFGEISTMQCRLCGRYWLRYYYANEAYTGSGRWYRGIIEPALVSSISIENAKDILENLTWYYRGGSYFGGKVIKRRGALDLSP